METIRLSNENLQQVIAKTKKILETDGLVIFPSDTVYGLAVNARSPQAVKKLFEFKSRQLGKAVSIAVKDFETLEKQVIVKENQKPLIKSLLPGPFTIVLPSLHTVDKGLEAEDGTLGVRIPDSTFIRELTSELEFPTTATSANISGKGPHYSVSALLNTLSDKKKGLIDLIIDAGELPQNLPSTVVNLSQGDLKVLRPGDINPKLLFEIKTKSEDETKKVAQELLNKHLPDLLNKALILILKGDLGTGKTVFVKGLGEVLGIKNVVSPTFVMYYEYDVKSTNVKKLHHFDLYRAETERDLELLEIPTLIKPKNILALEWGDKIGPFTKLIKEANAITFFISILDVDQTTRSIQVFKL